jgi:hypothetical protein
MTWSLTADACSDCLNPGAAHRHSERRRQARSEMATANWTIQSEEDGCPQCHEARRIIHSCQREKPTASQTAPLRLTTLSYPASGGTRPPGGTRQTRRGYHVMKGYLGNPSAPQRQPARRAGRTPATWTRWMSAATAASKAASRDDEPRRREHLPPGGRATPARPPGGRGRCVVGVPDDYRGEQVAAFVRPAQQFMPDATSAAH